MNTTALSAMHRSKFVRIHLQLVMSPNEWEILKWDVKEKANKISYIRLYYTTKQIKSNADGMDVNIRKFVHNFQQNFLVLATASNRHTKCYK